MKKIITLIVVILLALIFLSCSKYEIPDETIYRTECYTQYKSLEGRWYVREQVRIHPDGHITYVTGDGRVVLLTKMERCRSCDASVTNIKIDPAFYCKWIRN